VKVPNYNAGELRRKRCVECGREYDAVIPEHGPARVTCDDTCRTERLRRQLRDNRSRRGERACPAHAHGLNGYTNWRCRCDVCREASAAYQRVRVARKRDGSGS
jgi:hypothetical protein